MGRDTHPSPRVVGVERGGTGGVVIKVRPPHPEFFWKDLFSGLDVRNAIRDSEMCVRWLDD